MWRAGIILLGGMAGVDIWNYLFKSGGEIGVAIWYVSWAWMGIYVGKQAWQLFNKEKIRRTWLVIGIIGLLIGWMWYYRNSAAGLSGETTQEIGCAINLLTQAKDRAWRGTCLFGYPARQFFLPAIPPIIWGKNLNTLGMGVGWMMVAGFVVFGSALGEWMPKTTNGGWAAGILMAITWHWRVWYEFLFLAEQTIIPVELMFLGGGAGLLYELTGDKNHVVAMGLTMMYMATAYTPALAGWIAGVIVMAIWVYTKPLRATDKLLMAGIIAAALTTLVISFSYREDVRLADKKIPVPMEERVAVLRKAMDHLFYQNQGAGWISPIMLGGFWVVMAWAVTNKGNKFHWAAVVWILGVILLAEMSQGYNFGIGVDSKMNRTIIALPPFLLLAGSWARQTIKNIKTPVLMGIFILVLITGVKGAAEFLGGRGENQHYTLIKYLIDQGVEGRQTLYFINGAENHNNWISINDTMKYFLPEMSIGTRKNQSCDQIKKLGGIKVMEKGDNCSLSGMEYMKTSEGEQVAIAI